MFTDLLPLTTYCFVMSITPGPNNVMLATSGAMFGYRRALPQIYAIAGGSALQTYAACLGLGSLFVAFPMLSQVLRVTGAVYLVYLAWKLNAVSIVEASEPKPLNFTQAAFFQAVRWQRLVLVLHPHDDILERLHKMSEMASSKCPL